MTHFINLRQLVNRRDSHDAKLLPGLAGRRAEVARSPSHEIRECVPRLVSLAQRLAESLEQGEEPVLHVLPGSGHMDQRAESLREFVVPRVRLFQ